MLNDQTKEVPSKSTTDKEDHNNLDNIIKELPELLVKHAYSKLKSGQELTASESSDKQPPFCLRVAETADYETSLREKK